MTTTTVTQRFVPYLLYADAPRALAFLRDAFGFEERLRYPMDDGRIGHAEVRFGGHALYLASAHPEMGLASPQELPALPSQVLCYVDDVDAHYERAKAGGATIIAEPENGTYRALDPEGHRWIFSAPEADGQ